MPNRNFAWQWVKPWQAEFRLTPSPARPYHARALSSWRAWISRTNAAAGMNRVLRQPTTSSPATAPGPIAHLIGINGSGMQALAAVLSPRGWQISGSDANPRAARDLALSGATIHVGHSAANVPRDAALVIFSDAVPPENIERRRAAELRVRTLSYPEMLGELSRETTTFAVAGTHGKSTTTAMAAAAIVRAGLDPTIVCGATPIGCRSGGRAGKQRIVRRRGMRIPSELSEF